MSKKKKTEELPQQPKKKQKIKLTRQQAKQVSQRMVKLRKANMSNASATQTIIPFKTMFPDGTCHINNNRFAQVIEFYDTNYRLATFDEKGAKFSAWCDILNYFDNSISFQLTYENQLVDKKALTSEVKIPSVNDEVDDVRKEYSDIRCDKLITGKNGRSIKRYLTFSIAEKSLKKAREKLNAITVELIRLFGDLHVNAVHLNGEKWLEALYHSLNPFTNEPFLFDWGIVKRGGYSVKNFIAPTSMSFKEGRCYFEIDKGFGSVSTINILAGELSDRIVEEFLDSDGLVSLNFHVQPFDQLKALKFIRGKLSDVQKMKIDEQKKASSAGYDSDIIPENIKIMESEMKNLLEELNSRNERLFNLTLTVRNYAESKEKSDLQLETLKRITQKNNCKLISLDYMQEIGFASSLPLGYNAVPVKRSLPTSAVGVFIPFSTREIFQTGGQYYGINPVTGNMILGDRKKLKNPNGLFLGTPGSGKSFSVKRELVDVFLTSPDDILICDPEGEYFPLVDHLNGQVVKISPSSNCFINPLDINIVDLDGEENPISTKSDFIISLCEIIVGDKYGLLAEERSCIDKCARRVYNKFFQNPFSEEMPTLNDLLEEFRKADVIEVLGRVANSMDMYVTGSQNLFSHRTNIDINNRLVCFDIKELGAQLKKVAMLIIQDQVWNRVAKNRGTKRTHYYIDEFHLLLRDEQTAKYSVEMWKRFRKWGGIPSGITQNVKDILSSQEIENILDNSDFIYMLNQAAGDREILQEKLNISDALIKYVANSKPGNGLIFFGDTTLPFKDEFPEDTLMFQLLNTDPSKKKELPTKAENTDLFFESPISELTADVDNRKDDYDNGI